MIKLGTSPHPKNGREMYEDYLILFLNQLSKAHIKLLKTHQQTHNNHSMIPLQNLYINSQQIFNKAPFEGDSNDPVKKPKDPTLMKTNQTLRI